MKMEKHLMVGVLAVSSAFAVMPNTAAFSNTSHSDHSNTVVASDSATRKVALEVPRASRSRAAYMGVGSLKSYAMVRRPLSDRELTELLYLVGFRGERLKQAWVIAKKESNGRPLAHNTNRSTGDNSYGIFQINMLGQLGPERREKFGLKKNSDLFNPVVNAKIAFHMSNGGKNWQAWHGYNKNNPRIREIIERYPY